MIIVIPLTFLKELMLIKQMNQKSAVFVNLSNIAILNIKSADHCCIVSGVRKKLDHKKRKKAERYKK